MKYVNHSGKIMYQGGRLTICEERLIMRPHIDDDGCRPVG